MSLYKRVYPEWGERKEQTPRSYTAVVEAANAASNSAAPNLWTKEVKEVREKPVKKKIPPPQPKVFDSILVVLLPLGSNFVRVVLHVALFSPSSCFFSLKSLPITTATKARTHSPSLVVIVMMTCLAMRTTAGSLMIACLMMLRK